jgi:predicted DNA-binding protein
MPNNIPNKETKRSNAPRALRLPNELLDRVDDYARKLEEELHIPVTRSDAIRRLIMFGLEDAEDIRDAEAVLLSNEERVSWDSIKARHGL